MNGIVIFFIFLGISSCAEFTEIRSNNSEEQSPSDSELINCKEGSQRTGFTTPIVNGMMKCTQEVQICNNGMWSGPTLYITCDNPTEPCDGRPHGAMETGYMSPLSPCIKGTRSCIDGQWIGPYLHVFCN